jgi:outer membrane protein
VCAWVLSAFFAPWQAARAGYEVTRIPIDTMPKGTPGLGAGIRGSMDMYVGQDRPADLVPLYLYEGRWLFAEGTAGGVHLLDDEIFNLDLIVRYRFNHLDPDDYDGLADGLRTRRQSLDGGVSGGVKTPFGDFRVEWVTDLQNNHDGSELDISYRYPFQWGNFKFSPFIGLSYADASLSDYYYGVTPEESAATGIPVYEVGNTQNLSFGFASSWQATDHIFVFGNLGYVVFDSKIQDSPLVSEDIDGVAYLGAGYFFGSVKDSKYVAEDRKTEWSWRINYGYTGKHNIVPEPMMGKLAEHEKVQTDILGFTAGKLVQSGPRVDIYAKLALFRHLEDPYQDDFWNVTAYMMAIGKGYFPWSERPAFRWGFGFGASYAQKVPWIEVVKQGDRDRNTSKFLNYLEWTVDFPIDGLIKSKLTRNCYVGLTVNHRSGIFSTSDILGQVSGGSDWYTAHIECLR